MSSRMASKTALNCTSYRFSSSSSLRARWAWDAVIRRSRTKARMISTLTAIARGLFRTPESIATPCSVKAYGAYRLPPRPFEITICDLKDSASTGLRVPRKPLGVSLHGLHEDSRLDAVQRRQLHVEEHPPAPEDDDGS